MNRPGPSKKPSRPDKVFSVTADDPSGEATHDIGGCNNRRRRGSPLKWMGPGSRTWLGEKYTLAQESQHRDVNETARGGPRVTESQGFKKKRRPPGPYAGLKSDRAMGASVY